MFVFFCVCVLNICGTNVGRLSQLVSCVWLAGHVHVAFFLSSSWSCTWITQRSILWDPLNGAQNKRKRVRMSVVVEGVVEETRKLLLLLERKWWTRRTNRTRRRPVCALGSLDACFFCLFFFYFVLFSFSFYRVRAWIDHEKNPDGVFWSPRRVWTHWSSSMKQDRKLII